MDFAKAFQQQATTNSATNAGPAVEILQQHQSTLPGEKRKPPDKTLEDVSETIPGPLYLRENLSSSQSPLGFIKYFQTSQRIRLQTISAPTALMDQHGITRLTFHERCYDRVLERLCQQIDLLTIKSTSIDNAADVSPAVDVKTKRSDTEHARLQLEKLLDVAFPFVHVPRIRPAILHLLRNTLSLPEKYKSEIAKQPELYQVCDLSVKRQIWLERRDLFEKEIDRHIRLYIDRRRHNMFDLSKRKGLFGTFSAERRSDPGFRSFVEMIGKHEHLYRYVRSFVTRKFLHTLSGHYATLRADLIFAVHERQPHLEHRDAPVYKMAWMLEELSAKAHLDSRSADEMVDILRQLKENAAVVASSGTNKKGKGKQERGRDKSASRQHGQNLQDAAFLLMQPTVLFSLGISISRAMEACLHQDDLPKKQKLLMVVLRLLNLACYSPIMLGSAKKEVRSCEPDFDDSLVSSFMPAMLAALVDEQLDRLKSILDNGTARSAAAADDDKLSQQLTTQSGLTAKRTKPVALDIIFDAVRESPTAVYIFLNFIGVAVKLGYFRLASRCLRQLPDVFGNLVLENDYLIHYLIILLGFGLTSSSSAAAIAAAGGAAAAAVAATSAALVAAKTQSHAIAGTTTTGSVVANKRASHHHAFPTWPEEFVHALFDDLLGKELQHRLQEQQNTSSTKNTENSAGSSSEQSTASAARDRRRPMHVVRHILVCVYLTVDRIPAARRESLLRMVEKYCLPAVSTKSSDTVAAESEKTKAGDDADVKSVDAGLDDDAEKLEIAEMYRTVAKRVREKVGGGGAGVRAAVADAGARGRSTTTTTSAKGGLGILLFPELHQLPIDLPG